MKEHINDGFCHIKAYSWANEAEICRPYKTRLCQICLRSRDLSRCAIYDNFFTRGLCTARCGSPERNLLLQQKFAQAGYTPSANYSFGKYGNLTRYAFKARFMHFSSLHQQTSIPLPLVCLNFFFFFQVKELGQKMKEEVAFFHIVVFTSINITMGENL